MTHERLRQALHDALSVEAERISSSGTEDEIRSRMVLLFAGAETRMTERIENVDLGLEHSSKYFNIGRRIADGIKL